MNTRLFSLAASATCLLLAPSLPGQTAAKTPVRRTTPAATHRPGAAKVTPTSACVTAPVLSPKIPAASGAGAACVKSLYALKFEASHLDPQVSGPLRTSLEALNQSFSLNYLDTKIGTGELAQPRKYYTVNYTGYLLDGTKFDSSLDPGREPFNFPYGGRQVIQGWDTGFEGMRAGGKRRLFVPYQLAYGERGKPPVIPEKAMLIFDVEFLSQSDTPPAPKTPPAPATPPAGSAPPAGAAPSTTPPQSSTPQPPASGTTAPPASAGQPAPSTPPPSSAPQSTTPSQP